MKVPYHRFLSALCAVCFLILTLFPTAALAAQADYLLLASNRAQRIVDTDPAPSLLSSALLVEVLYYLLLTGEDLS
jgi:RpiR family carbohydrate utilization transcriptional regulator